MRFGYACVCNNVIKIYIYKQKRKEKYIKLFTIEKRNQSTTQRKLKKFNKGDTEEGNRNESVWKHVKVGTSGASCSVSHVEKTTKTKKEKKRKESVYTNC